MSKGFALILSLGMMFLAGATYAQNQKDVQTPRWSGLPEEESPAPAIRPLKPVARPQTKESDTSEVNKINAWTVGLAAGQREGAPLEFASDIARVRLSEPEG